MDVRKAYGVLSAVASKLGEQARVDATLLDDVRATKDAAEFRAHVRAKAEGLLPPAVLATFLDEVVRDEDWVLWRSRLLIQAKMTRDGKTRAAGHEHGKGVGKP